MQCQLHYLATCTRRTPLFFSALVLSLSPMIHACNKGFAALLMIHDLFPSVLLPALQVRTVTSNRI